MFNCSLKKKLILIAAAAVIPVMFFSLLVGGASAIDQAEQAIAKSGTVIEKITTKGGNSISYASLDGIKSHMVDGELRLHCSQSFTAGGIFISLKSGKNVTVTVLSVSEKQNDKGETLEDLLELASITIDAGNVQSVSVSCAITVRLNFLRLNITDSDGNLVDVELYALGFSDITLITE